MKRNKRQRISDEQVSLLLLSGGKGKRAALEYPKQFFAIAGHPMIAYSLIAARKVPDVDEIVVNAPEGYEEQTAEILAAYVPGIPTKIVQSGETRQESVRLLCDAASHDTVIVHEAARPMIKRTWFRDLLKHPAANVGYCAPISFSMCSVDHNTGRITGAVPRESTLNVQLPQKFNLATLRAGHKKAVAENTEFTEDAALCQTMLGADVFFIEGETSNIKVTNPEDFHVVKLLVEERAKKGRKWNRQLCGPTKSPNLSSVAKRSSARLRF